MENTKINLYLGEKPCDNVMKELLEGKIEDVENSIKESEFKDIFYIRKRLEERKDISENGILEGDMCVLKSWEVKDEGRGYDEDLYKVKRESLDESKMEKLDNYSWLYKGTVNKDDMVLVRKGTGLKIDEDYNVPFGQCYLNKYMKEFKERSGIEDLTWAEMAEVLGMMGLKATKENPQLYYKADVERYLNNIKEFKNKVYEHRNLIKIAKENTNKPEPKKIKIKERPETLEDIIWKRNIEAEEKRKLERIEAEKEMERISQEMIDKDNYGDESELDEGFEDAFDSSLIDYSPDFEKEDKFIYDVQTWIEEYTKRYHVTKSIFGDNINKNWDKHGDYVINADKSITFYSDLEIVKHLENGELPDYIRIKECKGSLRVDVPFKSFKNFPFVVWGSLLVNLFEGESLEGMPQFVFGMLSGSGKSIYLNIQNTKSLKGLTICNPTGINLKGRYLTKDDIYWLPGYLGSVGTYDMSADENIESKLSYEDRQMLIHEIQSANIRWGAISSHVKNGGYDPETIKIICNNEHIKCSYNVNSFSMLNLYESFENVFDSSLIDYSPDFEEKDKREYKLQQIRKFMKNLEGYEWTIKDADNFKSGIDFMKGIIYKINDDLTIDILNIYPKKLVIDPLDYDWETGKRELPEFIEFNEVHGDFGWGCGRCPTSIKGFPKVIYGNLYNDILYSDNPSEVYNRPEGPSNREIETTYHIRNWSSMEDEFIEAKKSWLKERKEEWKKWKNNNYEYFRDESDDDIKEFWYRKDIKVVIDRNVNESFENTFDSSLVDYSDDFEKTDFKYKKLKDIYNYMHTFTNAVTREEWEDKNKLKEIRTKTLQGNLFAEYMLTPAAIPTYLVNDNYEVIIRTPWGKGLTLTNYRLFALKATPWCDVENKENVPIIKELYGDFVWGGYIYAEDAVPSRDTVVHCFPKKIYGDILWSKLENMPIPFSNDEYSDSEYNITKRTWDRIVHEYYKKELYGVTPCWVLKDEYQNK